MIYIKIYEMTRESQRSSACAALAWCSNECSTIIIDFCAHAQMTCKTAVKSMKGMSRDEAFENNPIGHAVE